MPCALDKTAQIINLVPYKKEKNDVILFFQNKRKEIQNILKRKLKQFKSIKWYLTLQVHFIKTNSLGLEDNALPYFKNKCTITLHKSQIKKQIQKAYAIILQKFADWLREGSGWVLEKVIQLDVSIAKYKAFKGSTYFKLPPILARKKAVINVKNKDNLCFLWCVLAHLYKVRSHRERVAHYKKYLDTLNIEGLDFPLPIHQISKFEKQNSISINVYQYSKEDIYPLYVSNKYNDDFKKIDMLLIAKGDKKHYCLIQSLSRLLRKKGGYSNKMYYCRHCLHAFTTNKRLQNHIELCENKIAQKVVVPTLEKKWFKFTNVYKQDKLKFVIYCDFESLLVPIQDCEHDPNVKSFTRNTHKHVPCAYSYIVVSSIEGYTKPPVTYRGKDAVSHFLNSLLEEEDAILDVLYKYKPINMSAKDWKNFFNSKTCHICDLDFDEDSLKCRDHCHSTGSFRGASHANCNIKYRLSKRIPVVLHNLKNYDAHLIMQGIGKVGKDNISCVPTNMEKYVSFTLGKHLVFIDSFQFLSSSLQTLVSNLANEGPDKFNILTKYMQNVKPNLLLQKQIFPYEYLDSWDKFDETNLPSKSAFYSSLSEEHISDEDYKHAAKIWNVCKFKTLGEMCNFYVKSDALLLACVFENFRNLSLQYYKLDPLHYVSLPGLTFDACLRFTRVELELLTDVDQYLFLEKGIRGGISVITERFAQANNPMLETFDKEKPTSYIAFYDCNNLYGHSLQQPLPLCDFKWVSNDEIQKLDISNLGKDSKGYIFEVDLKYPKNLHDKHNHYPLAPEKLKVEASMLSPYLKNLLEHHKLKHNSKIEKLIPNLGDKKKYIVHYRTLQLYIKLGLKIKKIHRVLTFTEKAWVKPYVDFNTEKRKQAKTKFEQDMFKLMLNAFFGKCMENVRKRIDVKLATNSKRLTKLVSKSTFNSFKIFHKHLVGCHLKRVKVTLNKPIYIGFTILDLSKTLMYMFHYLHILAKYGNKARLLFSDTDSVCYVIETDDLSEDMHEDIHLFDTSNYPKDHFLYSEERKKAVGYFKDEMGGTPIFQFVGLRPKMYSILTKNDNKKTAKGISKNTIQKHLKHEEYLQSLFKGNRFYHKMKYIRSNHHDIYTTAIKKASICPLDDKRFILKDGIKSLAYNHFRIRALQQ